MTEKSYDDMINFPLHNNSEYKSRKNAFLFANDCRNKEIDRFWTRGLYFWGFIVSSFGAYIAVFNASLEVAEKEGTKVPVSLEAILNMSFTSKFTLTILSFICFIFCLSWLLVHKGSKFWQKNWENHIDFLEDSYMGNIYKSHLDSNNKNEFNGCILSAKAYDYSVSKISLLCSMLLTICSLGLVIFHLVILLFEWHFLDFSSFLKNSTYLFVAKLVFILPVVLLVLWFIFIFLKNIKGNEQKEKKEYDSNYTYFISCDECVKII